MNIEPKLSCPALHGLLAAADKVGLAVVFSGMRSFRDWRRRQEHGGGCARPRDAAADRSRRQREGRPAR